MGIARKDGHYFSMEEALYLAECGTAMIKCDSYVFPLAHLYTLLNSDGVSLFKYVIFSHLVRAGYIMRRPSLSPRPTTSADEETSSSDISVTVSAFRFPSSLLDQFPTISQDCRRVIVPKIIENLPPDYGLLNDDQLTVESLNSKTSSDGYSSILKNLRRDREHWIQYRPINWPSFNSLKSCPNWLACSFLYNFPSFIF